MRGQEAKSRALPWNTYLQLTVSEILNIIFWGVFLAFCFRTSPLKRLLNIHQQPNTALTGACGNQPNGPRESREEEVWENSKWIGVFIKNDKWPKRLEVPVQGKMEKQCKPQEGGLKCGGAAELVELPGHKSLSSSHLCAGWAKQRPFLRPSAAACFYPFPSASRDSRCISGPWTLPSGEQD